jgi:hypothetical protein
LNGGLLTANEVRRIRNLPPVEGGDTLRTPAGAANPNTPPGARRSPVRRGPSAEGRRMSLFTPQNATTSNVAASTSSVTLFAASDISRGRNVTNDSPAATLYLKFGTTASLTSYTVKIPPGGYFEFPRPAPYAGRVDGIWDIASGSARLTETSE